MSTVKGIIALLALIPELFRVTREWWIGHSARKQVLKEVKHDAELRKEKTNTVLVKEDLKTLEAINETEKKPQSAKIVDLRARLRRTSI